MIVELLATLSCGLALVPACLTHRNLRAYRPPPGLPAGTPATWPAISVLIPARDEALTIRAAVEAVLVSREVQLELLVLDDHSTDATAAIVQELASRDRRVRLIPAPPLPAGWCGKQHACAVLASQAAFPLLAFLDADVRVTPDGLGRLVAFLQASDAALVSGIPRQMMGTWGERLLIPLIHFLLLGFLPFTRMRRHQHQAYGSGCGQLFVARRAAYEASGGHTAIRTSLHDGLTLPRAFRAAGFRTDLCDATGVAVCRMYHSGREVWEGLRKNAGEGLASRALIGPATVVLFGGQVLPVILLGCGLFGALSPLVVGLAGIGVAAAYYPRLRTARRFRQPWLAALLHPLGVLGMLAIQWSAYLRGRRGRPATWKGRSYVST